MFVCLFLFLGQGESNMHQNLVIILCRLRHPFPHAELALFRYRKTPFFCGKSCYFYSISYMNPLFSSTGKIKNQNRGQNVTRNGGPHFGACLILAEKDLRRRRSGKRSSKRVVFGEMLFFNPGFGPETNVQPAIVVNHSCDTRMAEFGKATTSLLAPSNSYTWTIGPVTVALGTWHSAISPSMRFRLCPFKVCSQNIWKP